MKTFFLILVTLAFGCTHRNSMSPQNNIPPMATLSSIQANIFTPNCVNAGCHPGGGAPMSLASGQSYRSLVNVNSAYNGLARVLPGNAMRSALYLKVTGANGIGAIMPPGQRLTQAQTDTIAAWINRGALNN